MNIKNNMKIGNHSIIKDVMINVKPDNKDILLTIGEDCVIDGNIMVLHGRMNIGDRVVINEGTHLVCADYIEIGNDVMISWGCNIVDSNMHSLHSADRLEDTKNARIEVENHTIGRHLDYSKIKSAPVIIKDRAWIGFNAIILKGVTIGKCAIVGAGGVVTHNVPDYAVVAGNPARVVKYTD